MSLPKTDFGENCKCYGMKPPMALLRNENHDHAKLKWPISDDSISRLRISVIQKPFVLHTTPRHTTPAMIPPS